MRCEKHLSDRSSSVGVCATCLRERLLALIASQVQAQAQVQQAQLGRAAAGDRRKHDPAPLNFPRSVSPYVSRRKSDDNSAAWNHQRFYSTPQDEIPKFNLDPRFHHHRDLCDDPSTSSSSPSWFSAIFTVRRKNQQSSKTSHVQDLGRFGPRNRRACIDRGMSPAVEADSGDECDRSPSRSSPEVSPRWKRTPTAARRVRTGPRNVSGLAFCLSPLVRASPNRHWNQKIGLPPDMPFTGEGRPPMKPHLAIAAGFCANRSRKLADFGRVNYNR